MAAPARAGEAGARAGALPTARAAPRRAPCARRRWQGCPRRARSTRSTVRSHVRGEGTGAGPGGRWEQRGARRGWPEAALQRPVGEMEQIEDARARAERAGQPPCPRARGCAVERWSVSTRERLAFLPSPLAFGGVEHRLRHGKRWARGTRKLPARARFTFSPRRRAHQRARRRCCASVRRTLPAVWGARSTLRCPRFPLAERKSMGAVTAPALGRHQRERPCASCASRPCARGTPRATWRSTPFGPLAAARRFVADAPWHARACRTRATQIPSTRCRARATTSASRAVRRASR